MNNSIGEYLVKMAKDGKELSKLQSKVKEVFSEFNNGILIPFKERFERQDPSKKLNVILETEWYPINIEFTVDGGNTLIEGEMLYKGKRIVAENILEWDNLTFSEIFQNITIGDNGTFDKVEAIIISREK